MVYTAGTQRSGLFLNFWRQRWDSNPLRSVLQTDASTTSASPPYTQIYTQSCTQNALVSPIYATSSVPNLLKPHTACEKSRFCRPDFVGHYPPPVYNTQQNGPAVVDWGQEIRVGTSNSGAGPRVQTDTLQKYTDHAAHTGITSPAP